MRWDSLLDDMGEIIRDIFAQTVTYCRFETGEVFEVLAIFDVTYAQSEAGGSLQTSIPIKELDIRLKDIGNIPPKPEDKVLIDQSDYRIKDVKPSTSGFYKAILREVH